MKKWSLAKPIAIALLFSFVLAACAPAAGPAQEPPGAAPDANNEQPDTADDLEGDVAVIIGEDAFAGAEAVRLEGVTFTQSPSLDARVASGELPPVEERLPLNPAVWNTVPERHLDFEIGRFGPGPLRTVRMDPIWDAIMWTAGQQQFVLSPGRLGEEFAANMVESYEISDDLTTFTFRLREGMRWSDGHPVTSEDARFAFEDIALHPTLNPSTGVWWRAGGVPGGEVMEFELVDRYTFRYIFAEPTGGLILHIAMSSYRDFLQPAHYLKDFHIDYADRDVLMQKVRDAGFIEEEWNTFFNYHRSDIWYSGRTSRLPGGTPSLAPWLHAVDGDLRIFERNPFYWKVDPEGQQLPYIDDVHSHLVVDHAAAFLRFLAGDVDHAFEWISLPTVPMLLEHAEAGNFIVNTDTMLQRPAADIYINQTYDCEVWRSVARDLRFRRALSLAINREEIREAVYFGFARISDLNPTFDMDMANALLDEMGMEIGADGFRTAPGGSPFIMDFSYSTVHPQFAPTAEIVNESWRELGLRINFRQLDGPLIAARRDANELQVSIDFTRGLTLAPFDDWRWPHWAFLWNQYWNTGGEVGEPMPQEVRDFYELSFGIRQMHPRDIPAARVRQRQFLTDNYWIIIPVEDITQVTLHHKDLRNVPDRGLMISGCFGADAWWFDR